MDKSEVQDLGPVREDWSDVELQCVVRAWEKTVDVQQHFNDLELRVRSLALTTLTAVLAGAAYAFSQGIQVRQQIQIPAWCVAPFLAIAALVLGYIVFERLPVWSRWAGGLVIVLGLGGPLAVGWGVIEFELPTTLAGLLLLVALLIWVGFYVMDRFWYHRLLYGSVKHGLAIEKRLAKLLPESALSEAIGRESPVVSSRLNLKIRSSHKIDLFYALIALILLSLVVVI